MNKASAVLAIAQRIPNDEKLLKRLYRAEQEVLGFGYEIKEIGITSDGRKLYSVDKLSTSLLEDNSKQYQVSNKSCNCPDYPEVRAGLCKHRLAIMVKEEMES